MTGSSNNLLIFILALSFLLFTHELGHFFNRQAVQDQSGGIRLWLSAQTT